jgi:hypothetical protein
VVRGSARWGAYLLALVLTLSGFAGLAPVTTAAAASNPIVAENQQTGTSAWQIGSLIGDDATGQIKGYGSLTSVGQGQSISLYVSVNPAQTYGVDFYRIGWYGGLGGRLRLHVGPLSGVKQSTCVPDPATGLIACNWSASYTLTIPSDWTSGVYYALLTNAQGYQNYVVFVVRDGRAAPFLYQQSITTDQAYNNYPDDGRTGKSLYAFNSYGANTVGGDRRAVKVSFDRPYNYDGSGFFHNWEIDMVRWMERSGYDVTYSTDVDTHSNGAELRNHKAFLSVGHDEYWSKEMYDAAVAARDGGVNLGFFGADDVGWQVRFEASAAGAADRVIVCYKLASIDPVQGPTTTVEWQDVGRPEQTLIGIQYTSLIPWTTTSYGYRVTNSASWVYAGTGFADGDTVPGILGHEMDQYFTIYPAPPGTNRVLLSDSPFNDQSGKAVRANSSIYQAPSGAWVFAAGTIRWSWALDNYDHAFADARMQRATANIFDRFQTSGTPPALQISAVQVTSVGPTSATISWTTNNAASSRVDYGPTIPYASNATNAGNVTAHSVALSGLSASTTYHYQVTSTDALAQTGTSLDATFTTSSVAPNLVANPGFESGATGWSLDPPLSIDTNAANAHSGAGSLKIATTTPWQGAWANVAVTPGNTYTFGGWERSTTSGGYLSVFSYDANWVQLDQGTSLAFPGTGAWSSLARTYVPVAGTAWAVVGVQNSVAGTFWFDDISMTGAPPPPLQITAVQAGSITSTSAAITWTTNNSSNSRADYGTTTSYGASVTNATSVTAHSLTLSGLVPSTTYHFKVTSVDGFAQNATGSDATFTTSAPPPLQVSAVQASGVGTTTATVTWTTNNASTSRADYGTTTAYGTVASNATAVTAHALTLSGLTASTTYHFKVTSVDGFGQTAVSPDASFTTSGASTNLVANPGFEGGVTGWSLAPTASIDATAANAHSGTRSLKLVATAGWQGTWQSVPLTPGKTYTFSGWVRSTTSSGYLSIYSEDASYTLLDGGTHLVFAGTGAWTYLSGSFVPVAGTTQALIGVSNSAAGTFWFDDLGIVGP